MADDPTPDSFTTVAGHGQATIEVGDSEFIGHVASVDTVAEAEAFVDEITTANADATHNVPAYRVRDGDLLRAWSSDADEPSGSAGKPTLNVLVKRDLENVVAVVTRHFGGTELGVGGLARAYGRAVSLAVVDAGVVESRPHRQFRVEVEYDDSGTVRGLLESDGVDFEAGYEETVAFDVRVPIDEAEALLDRIRSATGGRATIEGA